MSLASRSLASAESLRTRRVRLRRAGHQQRPSHHDQAPGPALPEHRRFVDPTGKRRTGQDQRTLTRPHGPPGCEEGRSNPGRRRLARPRPGDSDQAKAVDRAVDGAATYTCTRSLTGSPDWPTPSPRGREEQDRCGVPDQGEGLVQTTASPTSTARSLTTAPATALVTSP